MDRNRRPAGALFDVATEPRPESEFQKELSLTRTPLRFLLDESSREKMRKQVIGFSDSACFHRLWDLFGLMRRAEYQHRLTEDERAALQRFIAAMDALRWHPLPTHPHVSELRPDDLSPLFRPAEPLLAILDRRFHVPWWQHLLRKMNKQK